MSVFVLDKKKHPLTPMSEKRARLLLSRRGAIVVKMQPIQIKIDPASKHTGLALARGSYKRTRLNKYGFPRGYLMRQKSVHGFQTGNYKGRVAAGSSGNFNITTKEGIVQGINYTCCKILSLSDGYRYEFQTKNHLITKEQRFPPSLKDGVSALSIR